MNDNKIITHAAIVPLAGGFVIGAMNILNKPPEVIFSYKCFESNDKLLLRYLKKRGYNIPYYQLDDISCNYDEIEKLYKNKIDFVTAVPPCSGLSQAAQRKAGSRSTAPPNDWMYKSAEFILNNIQPTIYTFENAPGLYTNAGNEVRKRLIEIGNIYGYSITFYKTNTLKHGIPQSRPRTFALFYKGPFAPILHSYNKERLNLIDYLNNIPKDAKHQNDYMTNDWDITKYEIYKFLKYKLGDNWHQQLIDFRPHITSYDYLIRNNLLNEFQEWQLKLPENERTKIVTKDIIHIKEKLAMNKNSRVNFRFIVLDKEYTHAVFGEMMSREIHPTQDRLMNIREFMHLMGLPHDYNLENEKEYVKISQNVPVTTCMDMVKEMVEIIKGERDFNYDSILMQDNLKEIKNVKTKNLF
ncbi:DNA cytosine methyltransferase [bacterium]|jgi:site-specific DNA-cytosine methylase|nr:DNA cytosine methyltransferase [bacterium]